MKTRDRPEYQSEYYQSRKKTMTPEQLAAYRALRAQRQREHTKRYRAAGKPMPCDVRKKLCVPTAWANRKLIRLFYEFAKLETERTGKVVEVDHIVPLYSPTVCGLHTEHNLQLLFAADNRAKGNQVWPGMP